MNWTKLLMTLCALIGLACAPAPAAPRTAALGTAVTLAVGETVSVEGVDLRVGYDALVDDSRCPPEVDCVWAGEATVSVSLAQPAAGTQTKVELRSLRPPTGAAEWSGYRVQLLSVNQAGDQLELKLVRK